MSGYGAWHYWFTIWPLLLLSTLGALLVTAGGFLYHLVVNLMIKRRREYGIFLIYFVPTALNVLLTVLLLREAAPDA
jgi:hypothetical protein